MPVDDFHEVVALPSPKLLPLVVSLIAVFVVKTDDLIGQFFLYVNHLNAEVGSHEYHLVLQGTAFPTITSQLVWGK